MMRGRRGGEWGGRDEGGVGIYEVLEGRGEEGGVEGGRREGGREGRGGGGDLEEVGILRIL